MSGGDGMILVNLPRERFGAEDLERVRRAAAGREVAYATDRREIEGLLDRVEIAMGDGPWDLLERMPRLRWYQSWSAGVDGLTAHPGMRDRPVVVTNTRGIHREQMAEHVFALILAWARALPKAVAARDRGEWRRAGDDEVAVLSGKTMLILGYGVIGEAVARAALAFGMRVLACRRHPAAAGAAPAGAVTAADAVTVFGLADLDRRLGETDFVVNILPHTQDTQGFMDSRRFARLRPGAVYVSVGRGPTTDSAALEAALTSGRLAAALLDVTDPEPLPPGSPLWTMDNVILTAHYGGMRPDYTARALDIALDNLDRYNRGETLINLVDKEAGY